MVGVIFSNIYDQTMGDLTNSRTVASLPFGGRYRMVDFVLSNMVNSGISTVGIITKYHYRSLMDHLGSCSEWDLNRKNGGLFFLPPYVSGTTDVYNGKLEALYNAMSFLEGANTEYVLLSDSTVICNIDYEAALASHVRSRADVTVIANRPTEQELTLNNELVLEMKKRTVVGMAVNCKASPEHLVGMGMFIMQRKQLIDIIHHSISRGMRHFEREFLQRQHLDQNIKVHAFEFKKTVLRNQDVVTYFNNNLRLMDQTVQKDLFSKDAPIYTKVRDEVPSFFADGCMINNCVVADGCSFEGVVENSVLFRDVTVESGGIVKNAIVMQGSSIGEDSYIEYAIIDKNVTITPGTILVGSPASPVIIAKGAVV